METHEQALRKLRRYLYVYIGETSRGDLGMFAAKPFRSGEEIVIDEVDYYKNVCSYRETVSLGHGLQQTLQVDIDAFKLSNGCIDDFTNHSCEPNTGIRLTGQGAIIVAIRDVLPHDELTYDYSTYLNNPFELMECHCGTPSCRRLIGNFKNLPSDLQRRYRELAVVGAFVDDPTPGAAQYQRHELGAKATV